MGLLHSGEVSDAGFWIAAERWLLNTSVRQWCSLTYWRGFRDGIFAITSNVPRFKHVFSWLRSRAALEGYKLLAEDVSQNKITFLAVGVPVINGCFVTKPREEYSAHPPHVHISCPVVLRKAVDQFVSIEKDSVLLKMISWQGFRGSSRVRQQFRESDGLWLNGVHERSRTKLRRTRPGLSWIITHCTERVESPGQQERCLNILLKHCLTTLGVIQNHLR